MNDYFSFHINLMKHEGNRNISVIIFNITSHTDDGNIVHLMPDGNSWEVSSLVAMETLVFGKQGKMAAQRLDYWCMKREVMYYWRIQIGGNEIKVCSR